MFPEASFNSLFISAKPARASLAAFVGSLKVISNPCLKAPTVLPFCPETSPRAFREACFCSSFCRQKGACKAQKRGL